MVSAESDQPELAKTDDVKWGKHNHSANFGRYVPGCPQCEKKMARGGFDRKQRAQHAETVVKHVIEQTGTQASGLSPEVLQQLMAIMTANATTTNGALENALKAFATELRKPDEKTLEKERVEAERKAKAQQDFIRINEESEAMKRQAQSICASAKHRDEKGRSLIGGQVCNDGMFHGICVRCHTMLEPMKPTGDMISGGGYVMA